MARLLEQLVGHEQIIQKFFAANQAGRLPQTFLFVGPPGIGKKLTAFALAQALICEKSDKACGFCSSCLRISKVATTESTVATESLLVIEPEKSMIKIDQAREILEFLNLRSITRHRVVIIDGAETLNPQAANSLLKILEEPPAGTFFFLIAPSPSQVLPTLQSRSQMISFSPLTSEQMRKRSLAPEWALRASFGSFEKLQMLTEKEELQIRESACAWLQSWMRQPQGYLNDEFRSLARDRSMAVRLAGHLLMLLRDISFYRWNAKNLMMNTDKENFLAELSIVSDETLNFAIEKCLQLQNLLQQNFDSSLLFEQFWVETRPGVLHAP